MPKRFAIEFSAASKREYESLRVFDQRSLLNAIEGKLSYGPQLETTDIKCLGFEAANFNYVPPLWELRVGAFRVFYEVDNAEGVVYIHAVRRKPPHKMTSEVLNEADFD